MENALHQDNTGAAVFIDTLNDLGIDRIFFNPGIDQVPIMAAIAAYRLRRKPAPKITLCTDESVAVAAAHGYAMVSGKPQVVALFEDIGTLQGGGALVNLKYGRIPVIICAGRNTRPNRMNWVHEPFDQRKIVRDYVKWDYDVTHDDDMGSVLRQAMAVSSTEPCGPVYLTMTREHLMGRNGDETVEAALRSPQAPSSATYANRLEAAADLLIRSARPLILTAYSGRHPQSVSQLVDLAETLAARVITTDLRMNFPSSHPLCPGMDCIKGDSYDHYIAEADVILLIDYDFPGPMEKSSVPGTDAKIIQFDNEILKNGMPLWGRTPDITVEGNSSRLLPELNEIVCQRIQDQPLSQLRMRYDEIAEEHEKLKVHFRTQAFQAADQLPISPDWLCHCINDALDEAAIIVHQTPSNADAMARHIRRVTPGTVFSWGDSAGSMGWALPAALGARLAAPDRLVVCIIGDGGFIYGCPVATLWGAGAHKAPFLTIIFNNQSYAIFKEAMAGMYGEEIRDAISGDAGFELGIDLKDPPDFAAIANGCHAYGQRVEAPSELIPALKRAIDRVRAGQAAVLDVIIA